MNVKPPDLVYLGPPAHTTGGSNKPITRIVIHCTVSACQRGGARDIARYFRSASAGGSAHYVVDPGEIVQVGYDGVICWHAPPNAHSLGFELCDPMTGSGARWQNTAHQDMLEIAARNVARAALAYDVPIRRLDPADLRAGRHGICGHDDVSDAWHQSSHWDPGPAFPWEQFMRLVRQAANQLTAESIPAPNQAEVAKERRRPTRVDVARRKLRAVLKVRDGVHDRRAIRKALRDLRGVD